MARFGINKMQQAGRLVLFCLLVCILSVVHAAPPAGSPEGVNDSFTVDINATTQLNVIANDLQNGSDPPLSVGNESAVVAASPCPTCGAVLGSSGVNVSFQSNANLGVAIFFYSAKDVDNDTTLGTCDGSPVPASTQNDSCGIVTVTVDYIADAPNLTVANTLAVDEDVATNLGISTAVADADGSETLSVTVSGLPSGYTLADGSNSSSSASTDVSSWDHGAITILSPANDSGDTFTLTVTATATTPNADQASTVEAIDVTVNSVNDVPVLANAPSNVTVNADAPNTLIDLTTIFSDVDIVPNGDVLTIVVQSNTNPGLFASTAVSGSTTGYTGTTLTLDYAANKSGTADITLRASEAQGAGTVDATFTVMVNADGSLTFVTSSDPLIEIAEDSFSYAVSDGTFTDVDLPVTITINPVLNDNGPTVSTIPDVTVDEDDNDLTVILNGYFRDLDIDDDGILDSDTSDDNDSLAFSVTNSNTSLVATTLNGGDLTFDFQLNQHGAATITVTATDNPPENHTVSTSFTVIVNSVNDAPIYQFGSYSDIEVNEDAPAIAINLASVFLDADLLDSDASDELLTYYITIVAVADPFVSTAMFDTDAFTTTVDASNNLVIETTSPSISLPPFADAHGYADITVRGQDQGLPLDSDGNPLPLFGQSTFRITINEIGDDQPGAEDDHYSDTLVLEEDDDGNTILSLDQVLTIEEDSDPVSIPVLANDYPGDVPARVVSVGRVITIDAQQHFWRTTSRMADPLNTGDTIEVINGEVMCAQCDLPTADSTLSGGGLPDDVVLYKPLLDFNGEDTFTYTIRDSAGAEESTATVTVLVTPKNDPPQPEPTITWVMDQATALIVTAEEGLRTKVIDVDNTHVDGFGCDPSLASCSPAADEPQPDTLYFQITQATSALGYQIDAPWCCDGAFTYRPDATFSGEDSFMFDVCDRPIEVTPPPPEENCVRNVVVTITVESVTGAPVDSSEEVVEFDYRLAQTPLELPIGPEPNVLVIMDDSGSMHWDILTDQNSGVYYYDTGNYVYYVSPATSGGSVYGSTNVAPSEEAAPSAGVWRLRNSTYNAVYYNPTIRYDPWKGLDASDNEFLDSLPTAARHNPLNASPTTNLTLPITYTGRAPISTEQCGNVCVRYEWVYSRGRWRRRCAVYEYRCWTTSGFQNVVSTNFYVPRYYKWTDKDGDGKLDSTPSPFLDATNSEGELVEIKPAASGGSDTYPKGTDRTDCETLADSCTYGEELQNFANWFTYSRNRELTAKIALGQVVAKAENIRIGYAVLNRSTRRKPITSMNTSDRTGAKAALLDEIYQTVPSGGTPLRRALNKAGRYYECLSGDSMGSSSSSDPGDAACPVLAAPEGNCQQNFALLFTDGTWNGSSPGLGNKDGDSTSNFDGGVYAGSYYTSLADVAMQYYERDLHTDLPNEVPTTGRDQAGAAEDAFENASNEIMHQHMSTYTVGFGVIGLVAPEDVPTDYTQSFNWGSPTSSARKTDDVLHAAVNGRGEYLSASNAKQLADALSAAFEEFAQGSGAASAVSFNSQEVQEDTLIFRAFYNTKINTGDLVAQRLTEDELIEEPVWSAAEALDQQTFDSRQIITFDPDTNQGIPFRSTSLNTDQKNFFIYDPGATLTQAQKDAQVLNKVNYLRGDNSNERPTGDLRERPSIKGRLGDIVHSTPVFVSRPSRLNRDAAPYPQTVLYSTFAENNFHRAPVIYVSANDGMLHGFSSIDGTEVFAYVPNALMLSEYGRDITDLLNYEYSHKYFVDLTPGINDIYLDADNNGSKEWSSVLVGGHGAGAKAYYALNITDPGLLRESTAGSVVLWEFTDDDDTYPTDGSGSPLRTGTGGQRQDQLAPAQPVKDLGYSFSVPTLAMSNLIDSDGEREWVVIFGNGYNSTAGIAKLFVLFADKGTDGTWCHPDMVYNSSLTPGPLPAECVGKQDFVKLDTGFGVPGSGPRLGFPNGLGTPRAIDVDANGTVDYVYAGDVLGNFFRFDLTSSDYNNWSASKIFEATYDNNGTIELQPITTQPIVVAHPTEPDGFIVIFATGSYITIPDGVDDNVQSIYGLWDRLGPSFISKTDLVNQIYTNVSDPTFGNVRLLSSNEVDYSADGGKKGWFNNLDAVPAGGTAGVDNPEFPGEKAIRNIQLKGGLIFVNSVIPRSGTSCVDVAGGFALSFCPGTGGLNCLGDKGIFDLDYDGSFGASDEVNSRVVAGIRFEDAAPTDSSFIGEERITQLNDKSIDRTRTNTSGAANTGRLSWKQLDSIQ